jgi:protein ImuA
MKEAFPNKSFPLGAVHEFFCTSAEDTAASGGFIAGVLASLMRNGGATLWISSSRTIFPPALQSFGIQPDKIIFIDLQKEKDVAWAMEEALKCEGLAAVVGEMQDISFTASRRLQLAVEQSRVTGFILRRNPRNLTTACLARWKITSIASGLHDDDMPGVGFPCWNVELVKIRYGKPGTWKIEWIAGMFNPVYTITALPEQQKKTG